MQTMKKGINFILWSYFTW